MEPIHKAQRSRVGRRRAQQKEATHGRIYEAARKLFIEKGYFDVRASDIASAAGVSSGSVFAHFGSKAKIMTAVAMELNAARIEALNSADWKSNDAFGRLKEIVGVYWTVNTEKNDLYRAVLSFAWFWDEEDENQFEASIHERNRIIVSILSETEDWDRFCAGIDFEIVLRIFFAYQEVHVRKYAVTRGDGHLAELERALAALFLPRRKS